MSNDAASKRSAAKTGRRPAPKPAAGSDGDGTADQAPAAASSSERAQEMRAALGVRQEAESLLADASHLRQRAAAEADTMVADAEQVASDLVSEARAQSERSVADAQAHAEEILARAQAEADALHESTESERARIGGVLSDVDAALRGLSLTLEGAGKTVADVLGSLERVRVGGPTSTGAELATVSATPQGGAGAGQGHAALEPVSSTVVPEGAAAAPDGEDARPLGWLCRNGQG